MQAYRSDQYLWWQVAEYTYDSFMIRSRTRGWSTLPTAKKRARSRSRGRAFLMRIVAGWRRANWLTAGSIAGSVRNSSRAVPREQTTACFTVA